MNSKISKFTIITFAYYKLELLKKTINSFIEQSYQNIEIIIVDNGSFNDVKKYLKSLNKDKRINIIELKKNVFSFDDPELMTQYCGSLALNKTTGKYVLFQSYDDPISNDYIEKMVNLFEENPKCMSAAGLPVNIDMNDKIDFSDINERESNYRNRYMSGRKLAKICITGKNRYFRAPGTIFSFRTDFFKKYGGFKYKAIEISHLYGMVPFGETGFDETAITFWRRHSDQLHHEMNKRFWSSIDYEMDFILESNFLDNWKQLSVKDSIFIKKKLLNFVTMTHTRVTLRSLLSLDIKKFFYNVKLLVKYKKNLPLVSVLKYFKKFLFLELRIILARLIKIKKVKEF